VIRIVPVVLLLLCGCIAGRVQAQQPAADTDAVEMDRDALQQLIAKARTSDTGTTPPAAKRSERDAGVNPPPTSQDLARMNEEQCLSYLSQRHIRTHRPDFEMPLVKMPLLLDSPIEGVTVAAKWPGNRKGSVMDCRLIAALVEVCRFCADRGVDRIEFYSAWRAPKKGHPSRHNEGLAIDIRWFTRKDGLSIDLLDHYERNFHQPPCDDEPTSDEGIFLRDLACHLHRTRTFNVVLTPNADEAHTNHFHFDITPGASWHIIR